MNKKRQTTNNGHETIVIVIVNWSVLDLVSVAEMCAVCQMVLYAGKTKQEREKRRMGEWEGDINFKIADKW